MGQKRKRDGVIITEADEEEAKVTREKRNAYMKQLRYHDQKFDPHKGKIKTLEIVIETFQRMIMGPEMDERKGVPLPAEEPNQQAHWNLQATKKISPAFEKF